MGTLLVFAYRRTRSLCLHQHSICVVQLILPVKEGTTLLGDKILIAFICTKFLKSVRGERLFLFASSPAKNSHVIYLSPFSVSSLHVT